MTPHKFLECIDVLGWSQRKVAAILGTHETTVRRWASGSQTVPPSVALWLDRRTRQALRFPPPVLVAGDADSDPAMGKTEAGRAFVAQRTNAALRGIPFLMSFEEWWTWWRTDNRWDNRGSRRGQFVMARFNDKGPYAIGNIYCATPLQNVQDRRPKGDKARAQPSSAA